MFKEMVLENLGIDLSDDALKQFDRYYDALISFNKHTNLTRITQREDVDIKHFYDSLALVKTIDLSNVKTLCDMGAGAGFPSIPLKIAYPHLKVTIIDSLGKRITFLKQLIDTLDLKDVHLVYDRIENHAKSHQQTYDVVTARALGKLPLILEMGMPMVKKDGCFIAYKGSNYVDELIESKKALQILKGRLEVERSYELPDDKGGRVHLLIRKQNHVQGYPRSFAAMKKKPL